MSLNTETPSASASAPADSQSLEDQLLDIQNEAKKNKVQLTPEIESYIREHLEAVQQKLANREEVTEDDMKFMQEVKLWVSLPEEWRVGYKSIEDMKKSREVNEMIQEASSREISPKQWFDLLQIAAVVSDLKKPFNEIFGYSTPEDEEKAWIDKTFEFPGSSQILTVGQLNLRESARLKSLPDNLSVKTNLNLSDCTSLTSLPSNLTVGGFLSLKNCVSLISLPDDLKVNRDLDLSKNLKKQVIDDAKRLKKEDKIKGEIRYRK